VLKHRLLVDNSGRTEENRDVVAEYVAIEGVENMSRWVKNLLIFAALGAVSAQAAYRVQDSSIRIDHAVNSPQVTIKYSGMKASLIEFKVNGKSKNSKVVSPDDNFGEISFPVDLESMDEGDNVLEILIFNTDGKVIGTQRTTIKVDRNAEGPVFLQGLKSGATVQGTIELKLGVNRDFRDLYVSFFVNDEWKALKNTQPYSYNWDTTRERNGVHVVQAWVVDEQNNTFKTKKIKVLVNNPGGRTDRIENPEKTVTTQPDKTTPKTVAVVTPIKLDTKPEAVKGIITQSTGFRSTAATGGTATGQLNLTPTGKRIATTKPAIVKPTTVKATTQAKPVLPKPIAKATAKPVVAVATKAPKMTLSYGSRLPIAGTYSISLNNKAVKFDAAQPRVENGVPLTPFRFLFEQAGGKVKWNNSAKEVKATGLGQEISFQVGNKSAKVNKLPVKLELAPFIEFSRAIVPLSFVKDSLKVEVEYDPNTGHVLITSGK